MAGGDARQHLAEAQLVAVHVGDTDVEEFLLGAREMADMRPDLQVYSPQSPMGSAIIGRKRGDEVDFEAPNGKQLKVEVVDAVPFKG